MKVNQDQSSSISIIISIFHKSLNLGVKLIDKAHLSIDLFQILTDDAAIYHDLLLR